MRTPKIIAAAAFGIVALSAIPAEARINQRQHHQQHRIYNGVANGSLSARETYWLERQQLGIARLEARSRADRGGLNWRERARIGHRQNRASRSIYRQKHD